MPPRKKQKVSELELTPSNASPLALPAPPALPKPFPFLRLPAELREAVYFHVVPTDALSNGYKEWITAVSISEKEGGDIGESSGWETRILLETPLMTHSFDPRVFLVCRQIHEEASALFYKSAHLHMFLSTFTRATQEGNGAGPSNAKYQLRNRKIYPWSQGLMHPHILGRFRRVTIHYDLGQTALQDKPHPSWLRAEWQIEQVAAAMAENFHADSMRPQLKICFWEPSIMLDDIPFHAYRACYVSPIHIVTFLERARTLFEKEVDEKDLINIWTSVPKVRADISRALLMSPSRHEQQLETVANEADVLDKVQEHFGNRVSITCARDWHHMPVWTFHPALQPQYCHPDEWINEWCPDKDDLVSESILEAMGKHMIATATKCAEYGLPSVMD
jgi:hypothetical protein